MYDGAIGENEAQAPKPQLMGEAMQQQARKQKGLVHVDSFC